MYKLYNAIVQITNINKVHGEQKVIYNYPYVFSFKIKNILYSGYFEQIDMNTTLVQHNHNQFKQLTPEDKIKLL